MDAKVEPKVEPVFNIEEVLSQRGSIYGEYRDLAILSQSLKQCLWSHPNFSKLLPAHRESLELICHKMARAVNGDPFYPDNWDDINGYSTLAKKECPK